MHEKGASMHLLGFHLPFVAVIVIGAAAAYVANYFILKAIYGSPDFLRYKWRKWILWVIGAIPGSSLIILALAFVATSVAFVIVLTCLILNVVPSLFSARHRTSPPCLPPT